MHRAWASGALVVLAVLVCAGVARSAAAAQELDARAQARAILSDPSYQQELPGLGARVVAEEARSGHLIEAGSPAASAMELLLWGGLLTAGVIGALWLVRSFGDYSADASLAPEAASADGPAAPRLDPRLALDAEVLASAGRYAEAIHVLLLRVFEALASRAAVADSGLTSRELAASLALAPAGARALEGLVLEVERSLFGTKAPQRADFEGCLGAFRQLAAAGRAS